VVYTKEITMKELLEMAEAHLINVQREMLKLADQKRTIEAEIEKINKYLTSSLDIVRLYREEAQDGLEPVNTTVTFQDAVRSLNNK
jgi:predicted  nucleic acid-binding Zn-ribbon protein